jgi:diguanylate cyclase (GGDEF)-like protein
MIQTLNRRSAVFYFAIALLSLMIANLAIIFFMPETWFKIVLSDVLFPLTNLVVVILLLIAAQHSTAQSQKLAAAWRILAAAQFSYVVGDVIWSVIEISHGEYSSPSSADFFYIAFYFLFILGVYRMPLKMKSPGEQIKRWLDISIILIAALLGFWNFLIGPLAVKNAGQSMAEQILALIYPTGDAVLFIAILILLYNRSSKQSHSPLVLLALGAAAMIVTDSIFSYQTLKSIYVSSGLLDSGWLLAYLFIGLAGISQVNQHFSIVSDKKIAFWEHFELSLPYYPYVCVIGAYSLLVSSYFFPLPMDFSSISIIVFLIISLVLLRQILTLNENNRLVCEQSQLLEQVQHQTFDLTAANQNLAAANVELRAEILERQRAEECLSYDSLHDNLTNLPNRTLLIDHLKQAIQSRKHNPTHSCSVLFLDLDQFKNVNDSLGHSIGDQLLIACTRRLEGCLRACDTVARFGGDEFVILLENTTGELAARTVAQRIQENLSMPFDITGHSMYITASIGIVPNIQDYDFPDELLRDADIAMYRAKTSGKARYEIFTPQMRKATVLRLEMENELRRAVEMGEFTLVYQPIFSLQPYTLVGFEALIRWEHPNRGLLPPGKFIPVAEETNLILPIGQWVLNEACRQMKAWYDRFPTQVSLTMSVNISGKQFAQSELVKQVEMALSDSGLSPSALKLEITESVLIENRAQADTIFQDFERMGIQLEIDDFGTGYSSLSYLQRFPVHTIKIDRSFISSISTNSKGSNLVRAMIHMAHSLGLKVIAEGIEDQEQFEALKSLNCQYGQGYLLCKPISPQAMEKILVESSVTETPFS